jgi:hypothetical protein
MSFEFLDYVEDILDAMDKAEILLEDVTFEEFEADFRINFETTDSTNLDRLRGPRMTEKIRVLVAADHPIVRQA